jgi:phenylpyruvate tautomerase PptA (4-oxalocrotonate tautomerase family)
MDRSNRSRGSTNASAGSSADAAMPNRRDMLTAVAAAAGSAAIIPAALAETVPATGFGAPLAELHFPAGVLTLEQKAAMIKGVTDVLANAVKLPAEQTPKLWVQLFETAEGGWGFGGQVFVRATK